MAIRVAVVGDIHGNAAALDAALADMKRHKPDRIAVTGDLLMNGPRPAEVVERLRKLESDGALVIGGNTDIAVADFDYAAAFPSFDEIPDSLRDSAEWTHDQLSDEQLDWLRGLPAERRLAVDSELLLVCHASPGSQTAGFSSDLDPTVMMERATRTDARVIACGHTHVADVRELGRRLIVNPGSCGYAYDNDPGACWALVTMPDADGEDEPSAELFRPIYDAAAAAEEVALRGLQGDVYRAATIRTGRLIR